MKRNRIRMISFLTALVLSLGIWGLRERSARMKFNRLVILNEQESLLQYSAYMNEMNDTLTKALYCSTPPMLASVAARLWSEANCAKLSLARLGNAESHLPGTYKFLTQVGDYTLSLSEDAAKGRVMTEDQYDSLKKLSSYARKYSEQADYAVSAVDANSLSFGEYDLDFINDRIETVHFSDLSADSEKNAEDFPTLVYDGPFADNVYNKESIFLEKKPELSVEEARKRAAEIFKTEMGNVAEAGKENGSIPCYLFAWGEKTAAVTIKGGYIRYLLSSAYAGEAKLEMPDLIERGRKYLETLGYTGMKDNYYTESDGIATVNYVFSDQNIKYYPDLIKVSISADKGEIVAFDATLYLMNHHNRSISRPDPPAEAFAADVNKHLKVKASSYAVIPTDGGNEILTAEIFCESGGEDALIYIDPSTGYEENILLLTYSDHGILTK